MQYITTVDVDTCKDNEKKMRTNKKYIKMTFYKKV